VNISGFSEQKLQQWFDEYDFEYLSYRYFKNVFRDVLNGKIDTWDYQWTYAIWENKGLCIIPEVNMISNIGFDSSGTHTSESDSEYANMPVYELNELIHPKEIIVDKVADKYIFKKWFVKRTLLKRISNKIKKLSS
ncbi:MAG TPA: hypothetical protein VGO09_09685, partial [Flavisolibacter sp.]|nr:hypothetical protein [Flavisolibacter sp.]